MALAFFSKGLPKRFRTIGNGTNIFIFGLKGDEMMNNITYFALKVILSSLVIAFTSSLADRKTYLAGFIVAVPFISFLSIIFAYFEYRDMTKINEYATSILIAVPLSLAFFVPFVLNRWLHLNFYATVIFAIVLLFGAFLIHNYIFSTR